MKKRNRLILIFGIIVLLVLSGIITAFITKFNTNNYELGNSIDNTMIIVNDTLEEITVDSEDDILLENGTIGTLEIPKIELVAPIKEGIDQETLEEYIGHFTNSSIWEGNVALASHNRGSLVKHYFDRIHELENGDTIIYKTKLGEKSYQVISKKEIDNTDWSVTENATNDKNTITLLTCITNHPEQRLCIQAEEI